VTLPQAQRGDAPVLPAEASGWPGQPSPAVSAEARLSRAGLRERGWTDPAFRGAAIEATLAAG
jgi:hypothetical protein